MEVIQRVLWLGLGSLCLFAGAWYQWGIGGLLITIGIWSIVGVVADAVFEARFKRNNDKHHAPTAVM